MDIYYENEIYEMNGKVAQGIPVPVLVYHSICEIPFREAVYCVRTSDMEKHLQIFLESGYTPITFEDITNIARINKPIMLTFDDGYDDNYDNLFPLLKKYHVKVTMCIIAGKIGTNGYLSSAQILEMSNSGLVSVQSHSMTHTYLDRIDTSQLETELEGSRRQIAALTGKTPFVLTYPMESYSPKVIQYTKKYYSYGLGCDEIQNACWITGNDNYTIPRFFVSRDISCDNLLSAISQRF